MLEENFETETPRAPRRFAQLRRDNEAYLLTRVVADACGTRLTHIMGKARLTHAVRARQLAMYLCTVLLGRTLDEVAELFRRDRKTVSYSCRVTEDRRDEDGPLDALIAEIEQRYQFEARKATRLDHAA